MFILNRIVDGIFVIDVFLQFFLMYRKESAGQTSGGEGEWEMSMAKIGKHYLGSKFFYIDVGSLIPSAFDIIPVATGGDTCDSQSNIKTARDSRLGLFKLLLVKGSSILKRPWWVLSVKEVRLIELHGLRSCWCMVTMSWRSRRR